MSLMKSFYGAEEPSLTRLAVFSLLYVFMGLFFYGMWADFVPSPSWSRTGLIASGIISVSASAVLVFVYSTGKASFRPGTSRFMKAFSYLVMPLVFFCISWGGVVHGIGAVYTETIGTPVELKISASKKIKKSFRFCDYRLYAPKLDTAFPEYLCITESEYSSLPTKFEMTLRGKKTGFGFSASWHVGDANNVVNGTLTTLRSVAAHYHRRYAYE